MEHGLYLYDMISVFTQKHFSRTSHFFVGSSLRIYQFNQSQSVIFVIVTMVAVNVVGNGRDN